MTNTTYTFGQLIFSNADELIEHCTTLRLSCEPETLIDGIDNYILLSKTFCASPKNRRRLKGRRIIDWTTKTNTASGRGLAAILHDGSTVSFNIQKAIQSYVALSEREF